MGDYTQTVTTGATPGDAFRYLADVENLPRYFDRLRSATRAEGDAVRTVAELPGGRVVEGEAWFRVDEAAQRIEWGSEGDSQYHGHLDVRPDGAGSAIEVHLHTERVGDDDQTVIEGISRTLASVKAQVDPA